MARVATVVVGISGGTGSGKSTLAREILRSLGNEMAQLLHQDAYYLDRSSLPMSERAGVNFDHPEAFDWPLLRKHVQVLCEGGTIQKPIYDFHTHSRLLETSAVEPRPVLLVEGILVLADPELRAMMHMKLFVDVEADVRLIRRVERDIRERGRSLESIVNQYKASVQPMHQAFVEPSKRHADIVLHPRPHKNRRIMTPILI